MSNLEHRRGEPTVSGNNLPTLLGNLAASPLTRRRTASGITVAASIESTTGGIRQAGTIRTETQYLIALSLLLGGEAVLEAHVRQEDFYPRRPLRVRSAVLTSCDNNCERVVVANGQEALRFFTRSPESVWRQPMDEFNSRIQGTGWELGSYTRYLLNATAEQDAFAPGNVRAMGIAEVVLAEHTIFSPSAREAFGLPPAGMPLELPR